MFFGQFYTKLMSTFITKIRQRLESGRMSSILQEMPFADFIALMYSTGSNFFLIAQLPNSIIFMPMGKLIPSSLHKSTILKTLPSW